MSQYEVDIQDVKVKVCAADQAVLIDTEVSELKSAITHKQWRLVALDLKFDRSEAALLIVYVGSQCLTIQLGYLDSLPESLERFKFNMQELYKRYLKCKSRVEIGYLAARVLTNPDLVQGHGFENLANIVGMKIQQSTIDCTKTPSWKARVFSVKQVNFAVLDAYNAYHLGNKFLDMV
ncbi:hypothetical protein SLEP1_g13970 [Rubroshorea leprosula]|uniref:3'-5' exonuclease domain-containing protein n=1 Tax=Rubroshorea leprosula TaxID=152421 RepID=A0AAV5IS78_9ROSI|nr:hypothetical protein SLEP1_g13970 [Rubroshorea leprosula]